MDAHVDAVNPPKVESQHSGFIVSVRVKPLDSDEASAVTPHADGHIELAKGSGESKIFSYDFVHWSTGNGDLDRDKFANQQCVYDDIGAPLVENARSGFNCTLFAFGQTGSGKTHTMIGESGDDQGLIPRICRQLLSSSSETIDHVVSCKYEVSYVEIYMEKVNDLLLDTKSDQAATGIGLRVREHPESGPFVEGCRVETIDDYQGISRLMNIGKKRRKTASTDMNEHSSRSHAIFILTLTQDRVLPGGKKYVVVSKVNLVDLAGSENARLAGSTGEQLKEGAAINKSLLTLGRVIKALAAAAATSQRAGLNRRRTSLQPDGADSTDNDTRAVSPLPSSSRKCADNPVSEAINKGKSTRRSSAGATATGRPVGRGQSFGGASAPLAPPYRDSVLTYLLRDSLGGNSKTTLVATIRPGISYQEETGITLTYASQARSIVNVVHVNENPFVAAIKTLQRQVDELKKNLEIANGIIAASATKTLVSVDIPSPRRDSSGSVQLASWIEEEDAIDRDYGVQITVASEVEVVNHSAMAPARESTPPLEMTEGYGSCEESPPPSRKAPIDGDICIIEQPSDCVSGFRSSSSESDSGVAVKCMALERLNSTDRSMLANTRTGSDEHDEVSAAVPMGADRLMAISTPVQSPAARTPGQGTWASVSSVNGEDFAQSPISPLVAPVFLNNGATAEEVATALVKCGFLLKRGCDEERRGSINCCGAIVDKRRGDALDPQTPYAFTLCTPQDPHHKSWTLQATSERERDDWILTINIIAALPSANEQHSPGALARGMIPRGSSTIAAVGKATCCVS